jgi:predicted enzyme related to lactoylglutathione lyase
MRPAPTVSTSVPAVAGDLVYFWIPVPDSERAKAFYGGLLGWRFAPGNIPDGFQITNASPPGGLHGGEEASHPLVCFEVGDMEAAVARVQELGGESDQPQEITSGSYVRCRDDQGTQFFLWAAGEEG